MTSKYIHAPWKFYLFPQPNGCPIVGDSRGLMIAQIAYSINHEDQKEAAIEHARIIAAAPELLEACKIIVDAFDSLSQSSPARNEMLHINAARAAITKALGETE